MTGAIFNPNHTVPISPSARVPLSHLALLGRWDRGTTGNTARPELTRVTLRLWRAVWGRI
ncbi:hypothetical protein M501DRAFT_1001927, partial [Patellaria atrata CBS 101060]